MTATADLPTDATRGDPPAGSDRFENLRVRGDALTAEVKGLIHQGNVQRIVVRNAQGDAVIEIPVTAGIVAAVVAPVLTGVAAIAALAGDWQIDVHRDADPSPG